MDPEISELFQKTARTRSQFIRVELQTCFTALELATYELSIGNRSVYERELHDVEKGLRVLRRYVDQVTAGEKAALEQNLAKLEAGLTELKAAG